ncbi:RNA 2'-phosphotransferase [Xylophilus sp. GW821-FHT01B05]
MNSVIEKSKFLSLVLRHAPEKIGLSLDGAGWAQVDVLLERANANGVALNRESLSQIVASSDKQRFVFSDDRERIRANQGHSVEIDLGLPPQEPPNQLFHGTAFRFLELIRSNGLQPMERQHVHLSPDEQTAESVGRRHGKPCVLLVNAKAMHLSGQLFFLSNNGVWLTAAVPPEFIGFPRDGV